MKQFQAEFTHIREILKNAPHGMSVTEIARALKKNNHSVGRYMDNLLVSGQVEMRLYGKAKVFTLSSRVPMDSLMGGTQDLILVLDSDNRIVRINDQFLQLIKKTRQEIVGKNISFIPLPDSTTETIFSGIRTSLESGVFDTELPVMQDGDRIFRQKIIPAVFEDGKQGLIVLLENITERKAAEQALRTSEEQFRMMADNIQDGMVICRDDRVLYVNRRVGEIFGYPLEEMSVLSPVDFAAPEEQERIGEFLRAFRSPETIPAGITLWIIRKDGIRRFISCRLTSLRHEESTIRYLIITDMTEWKHAQDALENQLGFLQHMIDTFPNPLFYVDQQGRYLGCNSAFSRLTGKKMDELAGKTDAEISGPWPADLFRKGNATLLEHTDIIVSSGEFRHPGGLSSTITIQKSTMVTADGVVAGVVGIILSQEPALKP
jgi:PAS domain S-box-containing protein